MKTQAKPCPVCSSTSRPRTVAWTDTSRALVGSSAMSSPGRGPAPGPARPLALSAGQFRGSPMPVIPGQLHRFEQFGYPGVGVR